MRGRLEVICGPMYSGKSEELIRRLTRHRIAQRNVAAIKPAIDTRYSVEKIASHSGFTFESYAVTVPLDYEVNIKLVQADVIGVDEAQFFPADWLANFVKLRVEVGKLVIVAGLDRDYRMEPFGGMPEVLARAEDVTKLTAVCHQCGQDAHYTQRLIDGEPAPFDGPTVQVGGLEAYEARCGQCFAAG